MTNEQIKLVKESWGRVVQMDPVVVGQLFYDRLFETAPEVKSLFSTPITGQSKKLLAMISYVIAKLDRLDEISSEIAKLARGHVAYGVKDEHYPLVGNALLWTLKVGLGPHWNEEVKDAWGACYNILAGAMTARRAA
jgi:hemoglobin-like flavoprotein